MPNITFYPQTLLLSEIRATEALNF